MQNQWSTSSKIKDSAVRMIFELVWASLRHFEAFWGSFFPKLCKKTKLKMPQNALLNFNNAILSYFEACICHVVFAPGVKDLYDYSWAQEITQEYDDRKSTTERTLSAPWGLLVPLHHFSHQPYHLSTSADWIPVPTCAKWRDHFLYLEIWVWQWMNLNGNSARNTEKKLTCVLHRIGLWEKLHI